MANITNEHVTVTSAGAGLLRIDLVQIHDDGIYMGGTLVCESAATGWLVGELNRAADAWGYAEVDAPMAPDHFTVYVGGSDMQPFVHLHNRRDAAAPLGGVYTLGMTTDAARNLVGQLSAHAATP